jgi:competence protein ComEA
MDGVGQWRLIESEEADKEGRPEAVAETGKQRSTLLLIAATVALVVAAAGLAIWATLPSGGAAVEQPQGPANAAFVPVFGAQAAEQGLAPLGTSASGAALSVVVDVQGAVVQPGVHELPTGSRVADAIAAAGGYAPSVDIAAASQRLNLAEKLVDGSQIHVPSLGDGGAAPTSYESPTANGGAGAVGGLIDLNSATAQELDTLPGIGPVTAAKIIDARSQAPFASIDELLARDVVGASTFEKIRELVTVLP